MATLKVEKREKTGKYAAFNMRKKGLIPGIVYGSETDNINVSVPLKEFVHLLHTGERIIDLDIDGDVKQSIIKDVQHGTFDREILHADFRAVSDKDTVHVSLDIELKGEAAGLELGGHVEQNTFNIDVECKPADLPEKIILDVTSLKLGDVWYVSDIPAPRGVSFKTAATVPVISCHLPAGADLGEGEEGEEATQPEEIGKKSEEG